MCAENKNLFKDRKLGKFRGCLGVWMSMTLLCFFQNSRIGNKHHLQLKLVQVFYLTKV